MDLRARLAETSALIQRAWAGVDDPIEYSEPFLASCFAYPAGESPRAPIAVGLEVSGRLAACVCGFPRRVALHGRQIDLALLTFFAVDPELKGRGLGVRVWAEGLRQAVRAGYAGAVHYCAAENKSNFVTVAGARAAGLEAARVFTGPYLMRFLRQKQEVPASDARGSVAALLRGNDRHGERAALARLWTASEATWQCADRFGAVCESLEVGGRLGALTGYVLRMGDARGTRRLFMEDVVWGDLLPDERAQLLDRFLARASGQASLVALPDLGYADTQPFAAAGFRRLTASVNGYLTLWDGSATPGALPALYLDVL